jgi:ligand-binding SRPBCC domain-containing protein
MSVFTFKRSQILPVRIHEAWDFLSAPANLNRITPPGMHFRILSGTENQTMYAGQIIAYQVNILPLIRVNWVTEITHVNSPFYFVDEQRFGPYAFWHHQHHLSETENGLEMTDIITYKLPFGWLGSLLTGSLIRKRLKEIFDYRSDKLAEIFPDINH